MNYSKLVSRHNIFCLAMCWLMLCVGDLQAQNVSDVSTQLAQAEVLREQGKLPQALSLLNKAQQQATLKSKQHTLILGLKANIMLLQRRYDEAFLILSETQPLAEKNQWWFIAGDQSSYLANLFLRQQNLEKAQRWFQKARSIAALSGDPLLSVQSGINLVRLQWQSAPESVPELAPLQQEISKISEYSGSEVLLNWAALLLDSLPMAQNKAQHKEQIFNALNRLLQNQQHFNQATLSQAYGLMARLYMTELRYEESLKLLNNAIYSAQQQPDLLYRWEWLSGQAWRNQGNLSEAVAALQRAVNHLETIRQDIPVDYVDGRSSFRQTLEPLYLELTDLLLLQAKQSEESSQQQAHLRQARATVELLKRSELEDYFDNRCIIDNQQQIDLSTVNQATAAIYPILLPDRMEILVSFANHIEQRTVAVGAAEISQAATALASSFRTLDPYYYTLSDQFYDWLISPINDLLQSRQIDTLIYLPDGPLRLVPLASISDGKQFLIEQYSIVTSPGLTLFDTSIRDKDEMQVLLAGLSTPGPVVDDVSERLYAAINVATDRQVKENLSRRLTYPRERREQEAQQRGQKARNKVSMLSRLRIVNKTAVTDKRSISDEDLRYISKRPGVKPQSNYQTKQAQLRQQLRIVNKIALQQNPQKTESDAALRIVAKYASQQALVAALQEREPQQPLRIVTKTRYQRPYAAEKVEAGTPQLLASNNTGQLRLLKRSLPENQAQLRLLKAQRLERLKNRLKLPGVDQEIENISRVFSGDALVNDDFSKQQFVDNMLSNRYDIVHIASHGVFGDSAENSFVMTYDEVLDMDQLEALLNHPKFSKAPVELITLSACQTADGDDRAPLGISGIALRAKVRSALGALWAVSDAATVELMSEFYANLKKPGMTKAQALREAQITMLQQEQYRHPFFWSAFILIGNWL
ncbi:CHAT domain-containing protein [Planctobacterium marinum]|uniref:CHAT domain-containing protein n=1 Tax=Planctobacterium marinum TaxID=1631968 RepID=A0AA48HP17_9ALTE|nr:hypothetical protein MACH26_38420 [Planctobacterium marinum]